MDDIDSNDYDSDEENEAYEEAQKGIRAGTLKCLNPDDTFRCPFSPGRKKQEYKYSEILQHASGVAKGGRGPTAAGKHRALQDYLKKDMVARAQPQAERFVHLEQTIPYRVDNDNKLVVPWMGILQNIDNTNRRPGDGFRTGPGGADIKEKLQAFNPESVKVLYDIRGHLGMAVIGFRNSMDGFKDAEAFENSFYLKRRGRGDFYRDSPQERGLHLYGWMATKKDLEGQRSILIDHLKLNGDLKSLAELVREMEGKAQQQVQNLKEAVSKKDETLEKTHVQNFSLSNLVKSVEEQRQQAEQEKLELIEAYKKELEDMQSTARIAAEEHERSMRLHRARLESKLRELEGHCSSLQNSKLAMETKNEAEKLRYEAELKDAERQLAWYKGQAKQQEEQQDNQLKLIKKHKEESEKLENQLQEQRKQLQAKQRRELESQRVVELLETEKAKKAEMLETQKGEETEKDKEEYLKKINELEEKLKDLEEDADADKDLVNQLTIQHREANDEVVEAKNAILASDILHKYGTTTGIGIKRMGELNTEGWYEVCKDKFPDHTKYSKWLSSWDENKLRSHDFNPVKVVSDGMESKYVINKEDPELRKLRDKYGPLVADAVEVAAMEIATWNPSGRYIVSVPWDFQGNKKASMTQIFQFFQKIIMVKEKEVKEKEKEVKEMDKQLKALQLKNGSISAPEPSAAPALKRKRGRQ